MIKFSQDLFLEISEILFILFERAPTISAGPEEGSVLGPGINNLQFSFHPSGDDETFVRFLFSATADFFAAFPFKRNNGPFNKGIRGEQGFELSAMLSIEVQKRLTTNGLAIHSDIIYIL